MSARERLRAYFEDNVGRVLDGGELARVGGIDSWTRRVRELRDNEGMRISSHHDREDLRPGQYVLETLERLPPRAARRIDRRVRVQVLERDGYTCQMCGRTAGDEDPTDPRRVLRLHIDHIDPNGPTEASNLRVLCSACNEGRSNVFLDASAVNVLAVVRRASRDDQRRVYEWLSRKFE